MRTQAPKRLGKNKNFTKDTEEKKTGNQIGENLKKEKVVHSVKR